MNQLAMKPIQSPKHSKNGKEGQLPAVGTIKEVLNQRV
jgi:hypothetical protein